MYYTIKIKHEDSTTNACVVIFIGHKMASVTKLNSKIAPYSKRGRSNVFVFVFRKSWYLKIKSMHNKCIQRIDSVINQTVTASRRNRHKANKYTWLRIPPIYLFSAVYLFNNANNDYTKPIYISQREWYVGRSRSIDRSQIGHSSIAIGRY